MTICAKFDGRPVSECTRGAQNCPCALDNEPKTLAERLRKWIPAYRDCIAAADSLESYKKRCERADHIILLLTSDHNSGPHYVKGFDMAQEYFQDFPDD